MLRLVIYLVGVAVVATALSWLADRPGTLLVTWQGYEIETSVFRATVILAILIGLAILAWSLMVQLWRSPASLGMFFNRRRQLRGLEALSAGMIAIGAGDRNGAQRYAVQARKSLPNEPLTHLLRAQAAQLSGDRTTARRIFEAMLASPETEQLGLRGLFLEAVREGEVEAARQFAERAVGLNPRLGWPIDALFELQCKDGDWAGALDTLTIAKRHQHADRGVLDRRRAVLMTAQAQAAEEQLPDRAMQLAIEAHHLAPDLIPAAAIAGRQLAARGNTKRAARIIERTWRVAPHPDLAMAYAHARLGDSPRDRLERVRQLAALNPHSSETAIAIATAAIEARDWDTARQALAPLTDSRQSQRVCTLMARIEGEEHGDRGRVREWLARAVHAPRDPAWTADGVVSDRWAPVSPVSGALDAFQWRVPVEAIEGGDTQMLARKLDELAALGREPMPREARGSGAAPTGEGAAAGPRAQPGELAEPATIAAADGGEAHGAPATAAAARGGPALPPQSRRPGAERPDQSREPASGEAGVHQTKPVEAAARAPREWSQANRGATFPPGDRPKPGADSRLIVTPRAPDDPGMDEVDPHEGERGGAPRPRVTAKT